MELDIIWEDESIAEDRRPLIEGHLTNGIMAALRIGEGPQDAEIGLSLVDNQRIHELNREYRGIDRPTDVLSFALQEENEEEPEIVDYEDNVLGDIVISVEKARIQAEEYGHSFERELVYLSVHGILHLLGYDHEEESERKLMRQKEEEVMTELKLER